MLPATRFYPSFALTRARRASLLRRAPPLVANEPIKRVMVNDRHCTIGTNGDEFYFDDVTGKRISVDDISPCTHVPACFTEREHEYMCALDDRDCQIRSQANAAALATSSRAYDPLACQPRALRRLSRPRSLLYPSSFVPGRGISSRRAQEEMYLNELAAATRPLPFLNPSLLPPVLPSALPSAPLLPVGGYSFV